MLLIKGMRGVVKMKKPVLKGSKQAFFVHLHANEVMLYLLR